MDDRRPSIAIIIPGGIGTGKGNLGVPVLEQLVRRLSADFELTVFSLFRINSDYRPVGFELIDVSHSVRLIKFAKLLWAVTRNHRKKNFRAIHGFWALPSGVLAVSLAKVLRVKSIVSILGGDAISIPEINYGQLQRPLSRKLILWALRRTDHLVVMSKYLIDNLKKAGLERDGIQVIPFGIDTNLFPFTMKPMSRPFQFLHIANLHPVKDQETLIRAFKIISEQVPAELTIIGEGIMEDHVKSLTASLGLRNVSFLDPLPYDQLPRYYQKADFLLHTSLSEGQPVVASEAMSSGVVVCGTKVGLMYDEPTFCIAVDVKDYNALANATLDVIRDEKKFRWIQQNAFEWAAAHSMSWTIERLKSCYNDAQE